MNMGTKRVLSAVTAVVLGLSLTACGKNGLHGSSGAPIMNGSRVGQGSGTEVNGVSGASGFEGENFAGDTLAASASLPKIVYFGFDKYQLTDKAKAIVSQNAALLMKDPSMHMMIEGHTDPRGSESYNFHLGERRANAVQSYFMEHGIPADQICTVSYGELRPAVTPSQFGGDKLKAYALDRRAVMVYGKTCEGSENMEAISAPAPVVKPMKKKSTVHTKKMNPTPVVVSSSAATLPLSSEPATGAMS